jgi:hypothetical protein
LGENAGSFLGDFYFQYFFRTIRGDTYPDPRKSASGDCVVGLSNGFFTPREPVSTISAGLSEVTTCFLLPLSNAPVAVVKAVGRAQSGSVVTRLIVMRLSDGVALRTLDLGPDSFVDSTPDGSRLFVTTSPGSQTVEVFGTAPSDDGSYVVGNADGRVCSVSGAIPGFDNAELLWIGFSTLANGRLALSCHTPNLGSQIGYLDTNSGELWLSDMIPATPVTIYGIPPTSFWLYSGGWPKVIPFPMVTISPDGSQLAALGQSFRGPPGNPFPRLPVAIGLYVNTTVARTVHEAFPESYISPPSGSDYPGQFGFVDRSVLWTR